MQGRSCQAIMIVRVMPQELLVLQPLQPSPSMEAKEWALLADSSHHHHAAQPAGPRKAPLMQTCTLPAAWTHHVNGSLLGPHAVRDGVTAPCPL